MKKYSQRLVKNIVWLSPLLEEYLNDKSQVCVTIPNSAKINTYDLIKTMQQGGGSVENILFSVGIDLNRFLFIIMTGRANRFEAKRIKDYLIIVKQQIKADKAKILSNADLTMSAEFEAV